jgi:hypothetical protein
MANLGADGWYDSINEPDKFFPKWFGKFGNNIQQISNAIYFCRKHGIKFTMPSHPLIENIELNFGNNEYKINPASWNWFYFFNEPGHTDFECDVDELNYSRKEICETYILPKLKFDQEVIKIPLEEDLLVIHFRSGDVYNGNHINGSRHFLYVQNPVSYFEELIEKFNKNVLVLAEDNDNPVTPILSNMGIQVATLSLKETYETLLRTRNLATSGVGSFPISTALCSKNIRNLYCSNYHLDTHLNPMMLKNHINVYKKNINYDLYYQPRSWPEYGPLDLDKILKYKDTVNFELI